MELVTEEGSESSSGPSVLSRVRGAVAPLLLKYVDRHPFATAAQWERAIRPVGEHGLIEVSLAEAKQFRVNVWGAELTRALHANKLTLINYTLAPSGLLRLHIRDGARWKQGKRKGRDPSSDAVTKLKDKIALMRLQPLGVGEADIKTEQGTGAVEQHPLAQVHTWLQQEFSDFRAGDRPLDMYLEAHARGVIVRNLDELRLSDVVFLAAGADKLINDDLVPDALPACHIDVFIAPGVRQHALVTLTVNRVNNNNSKKE